MSAASFDLFDYRGLGRSMSDSSEDGADGVEVTSTSRKKQKTTAKAECAQQPESIVIDSTTETCKSAEKLDGNRPSIVEKRKQSLPGTAVVLDEETRRLLAKSSEWRAQLNASVSESDEDADLQDPEEAHEISASSGESSNESEGEQAEASIILKLRDRKNRVVKVRVGMQEHFQVMFDKYQQHAVKKGWLEEGMVAKFEFDDEELLPQQTPADVECEGGEIIDVL